MLFFEVFLEYCAHKRFVFKKMSFKTRDTALFMKLTNDQLVEKAKDLARRERRLIVEVIENLEEISRRLVFLETKYDCGSIQEFCEKVLKYSRGAASRRVAAMRLSKHVPEAIAMYKAGMTSLETMQMVQTHSRQKDLTVEQVKAVVSQVEGLSQREAERLIQPEKRYTIKLSEEEYAKLRELKARLGTSSIDKILSEALRKISPPRKGPLQASQARSASKSQRQYLFRKSDQCEHPGCLENDALQVDHILEYSEGGQTELGNLRLLCPTHNRLHSREKVAPFLK